MANWRFGAFPKLPYSTMQQLNLDWILDRIRRFLPDNGTKGQVLTRTKDGAAWVDPEAASGSVSSVNGKTGAVVLTASDVGALPSSYQAPVTSVNGMTGDVVISGGGAVDSVNGQTGDVVLTAADVGALPESYVPPAAPVQSVNGQTGAVQLAIPDSTSDLVNDSGFITAAQAAAAAPVQSVNGQTGAVVIPTTPTWYYEERTVTGNVDNNYYYTVNGDGWIIATIYIRSDATSDTGTSICGVYHTPIASGEEYARGWSTTRLQTAQAIETGTEAVGTFFANNGDTVSLLGRCTKNGTKRIRYSIMCFGCTLTAQ